MTGVLRFIPGIAAARTYERSWLSRDLVAGLVLTALLVPQGMAYAELAGLPAITGLYTSIMCLLAYAVFGPSRILVLGPDSSLGPMIAATILPLVGADGDPAKAIALASMLAILVAVFMIAAGVAKLGFVADLFSKPTQIGYMNGLALTILIGQLPKLFGFSVDGDGLIDELRGFVQGLADGDALGAALAVGVGGLVVILVLNKVAPKIPGVLVAVIGAIAVCVAFDLGGEGVSLVGELPQGFPPFTIPTISWSDLTLLVAGALGITLVSLTDTISTSSAFAARTGQEVDANQEMIGIGTANLAAGLFQGFPVSTSGSRTAVAEQAGAKSQLTGVVGAVAITAMLLFAPGLLKNLPQPVLASVVIAASLSLADISGTRRLWHQRRMEFGVSMTAFVGVALLGVLPGIGIAVIISILNVFRRMWRPYRTELAVVDGLDGYHDVVEHPQGERIPGLAMFRFDAPLVFANARTFRDEVRALAAADPKPIWILVAAEPITDVDTTAADMLEDLDEELNEAGISLVFAEMKAPVEEKIERYELTRTIDPAHFFETLDDAVGAFRTRHGHPPGDQRVTPPSAPDTPEVPPVHHVAKPDRVAAVGALALAGAALVVGAVSLSGDLGRALLAPIALLVVVSFAWIAATRTGMLRLIAILVALAALGVVVLGIFTAESRGLGLAAVVALLAGSTFLSRRALRRDPATLKALPTPGAPVGPAEHGVLIMNLKSGGGKAEQFGLEDECRKRGIEPIVLGPDDDLRELAEQAVERGADVLGMAGGDGSQALVASVASAHDLPHVCVPAGTRNHFALDLGLDRDDVVGALDAYGDAVERRIDLAEVNGRVFVNNVSLGVYAKIIQSPEYRDAKRQTTASMLPELLGPEAEPFDLHFEGPDGVDHDGAQVIQVSNNPYVLSSLAGFGSRARLDTGELGLAAAEIGRAADVAAFVAADAAGKLGSFAGWSEWTAECFTVTSDSPIEAGIDGEALVFDAPLEFRALPGAVRIRLPHDAPGFSPAAIEAYSPAWTVGALLRAAAGRPTPIDDDQR